MGRLSAVIAGTLALPVLTGCHGTVSPELSAYLAVIDSVSEKVVESVLLNSPEGANVCFASTFWPEGKTTLSGPLQQKLTELGWNLYDPEKPPSPGTFLVFVSEPVSTDEGEMIAAGYQVWEAFHDEVTVWGDYWDYSMNCRRNSCSVAEAFGKSHYDAASTPVDEYMARDQGVCAGSVPGLMEAVSTSDSGEAGSTVP